MCRWNVTHQCMQNNDSCWESKQLKFATSGYFMKCKLYVYSYSLVLHLMEQALKDVAPHAVKVSVEVYRCAHRLWLARLISVGALVWEGTEQFKANCWFAICHLWSCKDLKFEVYWVRMVDNVVSCNQILVRSRCLSGEMEMTIRQSMPSAFCSSAPSGSQVSIGVAEYKFLSIHSNMHTSKLPRLQRADFILFVNSNMICKVNFAFCIELAPKVHVRKLWAVWRTVHIAFLTAFL